MNGLQEKPSLEDALLVSRITSTRKREIKNEDPNDYFRYNKETGIITWKKSTHPNVSIGDVAGTFDKDGYIQISFFNKIHKAHRLGWFLEYGYFPENGLDHKDRIKHHNWIKNLREVSPSCNNKNTPLRSDNTSGVKGVGWLKVSNKWYSRITSNGIKIRLGSFLSKTEAVMARYFAELDLKFYECDSQSTAKKYLITVIGISVDELLIEARKREEERKQKFLSKKRR